MNRRSSIRLLLALLTLCILSSVAFAGGWATITLSEFPDYTVAGKPLQLTFVVRQHGVTLLSGLSPSIQAKSARGLTATTRIVPGHAPGEYKAALTLPEPGEWTITINSGFNDNATTLPSLRVIAAESATPTAFSPSTRGVRLFAAKGCIGCHRHVEVNPERTADAKFDLTGKRFSPDYLKKFLADPSIKTTDMPNLNLNGEEIEALAAFINKGLQKQQTR